MRFALSVLLLGIVAACFAQGDEATLNRPDISIRVKEHTTGADLVEITMTSAEYPADLLRQQIGKIGTYLGSAPRGLSVFKNQLGDNPKLKFIKATFAVDGLIDRPKGILRIEPILKAFAGASEPYAIDSFLISFDGEFPTAKMIKNFKKPNVLEAVANFSDKPPVVGVDYNILLLTQDVDQITFPEQYEAPNQKPAAAPSQDNRGVLIALFVVAGLALGALVYLALLRTGKKTH